MGRVLNLSPLFTAQRIADELTARCGIEYFLQDEDEGAAFRLDPEKIQRVVDLARRDAVRGMPWLEVGEQELAFCRKLLRRSLIQRLTLGMIEAGF